MTCETFRARLTVDDRRPEILAHLRSCDACLDFAAQSDPDVLFRALGGDGELLPPGGLDAFVGGVMQQIQVRGKESELASPRPVVAWPYRWAAAAAVAVALVGTVLIDRTQSPSLLPAASTIAAVRPVLTPSASPVADDGRPTVEHYASDKATIVEVPNEGASDVKIVMVFDESLPSNL